MKCSYVAAVLACAVAVAVADVVVEDPRCTPDYCSANPCVSVFRSECTDEHEVYVEHGSTCGCCAICGPKISRTLDEHGLEPLLTKEEVAEGCVPGIECA